MTKQTDFDRPGLWSTLAVYLAEERYGVRFEAYEVPDVGLDTRYTVRVLRRGAELHRHSGATLPRAYCAALHRLDADASGGACA